MFKLENKKYFIGIYALILSLFSLYFTYRANFSNPEFEVLMFCILLIAEYYLLYTIQKTMRSYIKLHWC